MSVAASVRARRSIRDAALAFVELTKPRIILLLLITTVPAMILARGGMPSPWLIGATLVGGTLAAGGANAMNQYLDRDIDEVMRRTRHRPLPAHRIDPRTAFLFGVALGGAGFAWLALLVNLLAAALAASAILFYVLVYTVLLKRSTPQNIVIGGAAGAVPVLVGWAAATGTVAAPAWVLFAVVFLWTPPHFWALALKHAPDYRAAGVPMLPVTAGVDATTLQILLYAVAVVAASAVLVPVAGMGWLYAVAAALLGAWFVGHAVRLRLDRSVLIAMRLFRASIWYLGLLFAAVAADALLR